MTINEEQALKDFLLDVSCLKKLDPWKDYFNLFDVLKITNMEIRHSNVLAWLFDPNENHGLGDSFIQSFITKLVSKIDHNKFASFDLLLQNFYSYQVYREFHNIDIVLASRDEKTTIIIENKIWSGESTHQLSNYLEKSKSEFKDFSNILFVFLTPHGKEASDSDNWISFSYGEIVECLKDSIEGTTLHNEVSLVIKNYIDIVRKNIMKEKDERLVAICNDIYNKHRAALRLIFENTNINNSVDHEIICEVLRELHDENQIIFKDENKWHFYTIKMDEFLPELETSISSWGTKWVYYYWLAKDDEKLVIHFELGGWNLTDELTKNSNLLIKAAKKKLDTYKYKRLYHKTAKITQDDYEESLKIATKSLIKSALENEKKLLSNISEVVSEL